MLRHQVRAALTLTLAAIATLAGACPALAAVQHGPIQPPSRDPFYTPPTGYQSTAPGTILRWRQIPPTFADPIAGATYQLLFRSTDAHGRPIPAATTLLIPALPAPGPRRLLSHQIAEDSDNLDCAPSYTLRTGTGIDDDFMTEELEGWDILLPDHEGPQATPIVGPTEGRITLDSIRAAEHFAPADLRGAQTKVALSGYSGGSVPTMWAAALAPSYAPELNLVAVVAGGIPADLDYVLAHADGSLLYAGVMIAAIGIDRTYPEMNLNSLLTPAGMQFRDRIARTCEIGPFLQPFARTSTYFKFPSGQALAADPTVKAVLAHLDLVTGPVPKAPSLIYQTAGDELARAAQVDHMVNAYCRGGDAIEYEREPIGEHVTGLLAYQIPAIGYIADRFAGKPAPNTCPPSNGSGP